MDLSKYDNCDVWCTFAFVEIESTEEATCWFAVLPKNVKLVQNIYFKMPGIAASRPLCGAVCWGHVWHGLSSPWSPHRRSSHTILSTMALRIHVPKAHLDLPSVWINFKSLIVNFLFLCLSLDFNYPKMHVHLCALKQRRSFLSLKCSCRAAGGTRAVTAAALLTLTIRLISTPAILRPLSRAHQPSPGSSQ